MRDKQQEIDENVSRLHLIQKVLDSEEGHKLLTLLIKSHGLNTSAPSLEPQVLAYYEGKKAVIFDLLQAVSEDPHTYRKLLEESYQEENTFGEAQ